ncbi:glycoside hydrolase family 88/105 protein [Pedobacter mucosus]|uniref:glycoside hydrolase family 88/105 protein n=1 Tax=Pedobacter mucosus TaxID=2895286 RepID=UPI001EE43653|nr:glycoside hydrolase family 88 protein [Pedobacter mucosus]UKT65941.1 glycoside hydrolase family 88 protein [Pedobacter mucosus]
MKKTSLAILLTVSTLFSQAQSSLPEDVIRRVANNVIDNTSYQFKNTKTGVKYPSTKGLESMPDLRAESAYNKWFYPMGVLAVSMVQLSSLTGDIKYADYAAHNYDFVFSNSAYFEKLYKQNVKTEWTPFFAMNDLDACGALAAGLADVNLTAKRADYAAYLKRVADYISTKQVRLADKTLVRPGPRKMTLWADDLYMSVPLLARMGQITGDSKYFDDAIMQVENFNKYLFDEGSGLYIHCYYTDVKKQGVARWGRCNGWLALAQTELLAALPNNHPKRKQLIDLLMRQIVGFARYQDKSGLWNQVLDKRDSYLETSATAMFTYAVAKAVNEGWIPKSYISIAKEGWRGVASKVDGRGGVFDVCIGTGISDAVSFYYNRPVPYNDEHGVGPVIMAGTEMVKFNKANPAK